MHKEAILLEDSFFIIYI